MSKSSTRAALAAALIGTAPFAARAESAPEEVPTDASSSAEPATDAVDPSQRDGSSDAESSDEMEEIIVLGAPARKAPSSVLLLSAEDLAKQEYDDVHRVLEAAPGVFTRTEDGFGLRPNIGVRGANSDRSKKVTLMEDGVLFGPAPYSAPAAYYFPLATRMSAINVVKGASGIIHGPQTVAGSLDMRTRPVPYRETMQLDAAVGDFGYRKLHGYAGASGEHLGFVLEGVHLRSGGFRDLDGGGNTGFYRNEWMGKALYVVDPTSEFLNEFTLKLGYSDELSNETYLGLSETDAEETPLRRYFASQNDQMRWHRTQAVLSHKYIAPGGFKLDTSIYRHDLDRTWNRFKGFGGSTPVDAVLNSPEGGQRQQLFGVLTGQADTGSAAERLHIGPNTREFVSQGIQSRARWEATTGPIDHSFEAGVRFHYDSIRRDHSEQPFDVVDGELVRAPTAEIFTDDNTAETYALAIHAYDQLSWGALTLAPGIRAELIRFRFEDRLQSTDDGPATATHNYAVFIPGVGGTYTFNEQWSTFAGVFRGFSPIAPSLSPQDTGEEDAINYEAGVRFRQNTLSAEVVGFFNDYSNLTDICTQSNRCLAEDLDRQFDAGSAQTGGVEVLINALPTINVGTKSLGIPMSLAYTWTQTRFLENFDSKNPQFGTVRAGDEMPYIPQHQLGANIGVDYQDFSTTLSGFYTSEMREQAGSGEIPPELRIEPNLRLDLSLRYTFTDWISGYVNARNLTNSLPVIARRPLGPRPAPPRMILGGVKIEL